MGCSSSSGSGVPGAPLLEAPATPSAAGRPSELGGTSSYVPGPRFQQSGSCTPSVHSDDESSADGDFYSERSGSCVGAIGSLPSGTSKRSAGEASTLTPQSALPHAGGILDTYSVDSFFPSPASDSVVRFGSLPSGTSKRSAGDASTLTPCSALPHMRSISDASSAASICPDAALAGDAPFGPSMTHTESNNSHNSYTSYASDESHDSEDRPVFATARRSLDSEDVPIAALAMSTSRIQKIDKYRARCVAAFVESYPGDDEYWLEFASAVQSEAGARRRGVTFAKGLPEILGPGCKRHAPCKPSPPMQDGPAPVHASLRVQLRLWTLDPGPCEEDLRI